LAEAARIGIRTHLEIFPFESVPTALLALKRGVRGAAVIRVTPPE
jgi:hypothetical protein